MFDSEDYVRVINGDLYLTRSGIEFMINWAKMTIELWKLTGEPEDDMSSDVAALLLVLEPMFKKAYHIES